MASIVVPRRSLSYDEARARVLDSVTTLPAISLPTAEAAGRALRESPRAAYALPPFRNSAMDGWAVRSEDLAAATEARPVRLALTVTIAAGGAMPERLAPGSTARIMTGAMLPEGADAVVPLEEGPPDPREPSFARPVPRGQHVREAGADLAAGDVALDEGRELSPHDLALLAALGHARVAVGPRPRAIVLSTGDELLAIDAPLRPGRIRDSNTLLLSLLLREAGAEWVRAERLRDDPAQVASRLAAARAGADVVITIGGVSMGDFDPVRDAIAGEPGIELWRVAMRPGQPQAFGARDGRPFFGLPGNPASVACVFEALVRPALRRMQGHAALDRPRLEVRAAAPIESKAGRTDFVRVELVRDGSEWRARPAGTQLSGHLTPQSRAHALLVVPPETARLDAGDRATAWILRWPESA